MSVPIPRMSWRQWVIVGAASALLASAGVVGFWAGRYARLITRLNHSVGDTVFYDALDRPWFRLDEQRQDVPLDRVSAFLKDAVIAVEDHRYYAHPGIDPLGLARAFVHNLRADGSRQGGSTLTQQLARTLFLSNTRTYGRKVKEAALALMLEVQLSKKEILELYLNRVYLGAGIFGVENMARKTFGKPAAQLTLAESAVIAGVIRVPAAYSPWSHPDAAQRRARVVLRRMREERKITLAQEQNALSQRLRFAPAPRAARARHGYVKDLLRQQFRDMVGDDDPPDWKVRTTLVPEVQDAAEAAVREGLARAGISGLQAALVALDPHSGNLLAIVGGSDAVAAPFNRATRGRRQPGSAFKPFLYALALERGHSPVSRVSGLQHVRVSAPEGVWYPRDERESERDELTLREALFTSSNAAAVVLQQRLGTGALVRWAENIGVARQPTVPSLALGSGVVTPLELTAAYAVFPTMGLRVRPRALVDVLDASGRRVHHVHVETERVLSPQVAFQMLTMLRDVVDRGTGAAVRRLGVDGDVAGKTGTTNDNRDAWFVGFSSAVVTGVWVGFDDARPMATSASGARLALPIWAEFMRRTRTRLPATHVEPPQGLVGRPLCRTTFQQPVQGCPTYVEYFKSGDQTPITLCPVHDGSTGERVERAIQGFVRAIGRRFGGIFR